MREDAIEVLVFALSPEKVPEVPPEPSTVQFLENMTLKRACPAVKAVVFAAPSILIIDTKQSFVLLVQRICHTSESAAIPAFIVPDIKNLR
jgi:hypothetical protein